MSYSFKSETVTGTTTDAGAATIRLTKTTLGYDPALLHAQHTIQTTIASGSWALQGLGPNGVAMDLVTGCDANDLIMVGPKGLSTLGTGPTIADMGQNAAAYFRFSEYRIVVAGGGDEQSVTVHIRSDAVAW